MRSQAKCPVASWPAKTIIMVHTSGTVLPHMYVVSYVKAIASPSRPLAVNGMVDCTCVC